jgi:hypothetical protein
VSNLLNDHELTVLVDRAAAGVINSQAAHQGGLTWDDLSAGRKNEVREKALPFIFHGTKALAELGWQRPRTITTEEELASLPDGAIVVSAWATYQLVGPPFHTKEWVTLGGPAAVNVELPATLVYEPAAGSQL